MKDKKKSILLFILFILFFLFLIYIFRIFLCPVEIIAVHEDDNYSSVLVKNFPMTDKGKINWWLKNKNMLKSHYGIPRPASYGGYNVTFWLFDEGYKDEGGYDRLCFKDMKGPINCIEKDAVFSVDNSTNLGTIFTVYNGRHYRIDKRGEVVEIPTK
ncbi:DUF943 family protein [Pseudescherichia sp.]|uniref:DUF943 family protein n=1 Tax=Pseudescherichia sp. TaxID=2055881 RepID=UPI0028AC0A63|nr:DUF943 family protein [Pseudescherichia sp.]